jgi:hypothetical protein
VHYIGAGAGAQEALWTFTVSPGQYRVAATWSPHANRATDAPFSISLGGAEVSGVAIDQQQAPNDLTDAGTVWEYLGDVLDAGATTLVVKLTDLANGYTIADAIRLERIGDLPGGMGRPQQPAGEEETTPSSSEPEEPSEKEATSTILDIEETDPTPRAEPALSDLHEKAQPRSESDEPPVPEESHEPGQNQSADVAPAPTALSDPGDAAKPSEPLIMETPARSQTSGEPTSAASDVSDAPDVAEHEMLTLVVDSLAQELQSIEPNESQAGATAEPSQLRKEPRDPPLVAIQQASDFFRFWEGKRRQRMLRLGLQRYVDLVFASDDLRS